MRFTWNLHEQMADESVPYPDIVKRRIRAGKSLSYLNGVVDGSEEPNSVRVRAAIGLLAKVAPDMKAVEQSGELSLALPTIKMIINGKPDGDT